MAGCASRPAAAAARRRRRRAVARHGRQRQRDLRRAPRRRPHSARHRAAARERQRLARRLRPAADAFVLVTVGRLVARKETTQLVAAHGEERRRTRHLLVVGDGPDEAAIREAAAAHGVADRVHLLGSLGEVDKYRARRCRRLRLHQPARGLRPGVPGSDGVRPAGRLLRPRRADRLSLRPARPASCCT